MLSSGCSALVCPCEELFGNTVLKTVRIPSPIGGADWKISIIGCVTFKSKCVLRASHLWFLLAENATILVVHHEQDTHLPSPEAAAQHCKCFGGGLIDTHPVQSRRLLRLDHGMVLLAACLHRLRRLHHPYSLPPGASDFLLRPWPLVLRDCKSDHQERSAGATTNHMWTIGSMRILWLAFRPLSVYVVLRYLSDVSFYF